MSEWISVEDRTPSHGDRSRKGQVLALFADGHQRACWFRGGWFHIGFTTYHDVTHWMPLPNPPSK